MSNPVTCEVPAAYEKKAETVMLIEQYKAELYAAEER